MFEFKTVMHAIPTNQLWIYYGLVIVTYIIFLRKLKFTHLTVLILLIFNRGLLQIIDYSGLIYKILSSIIILDLFFRNSNKIVKTRKISKILFLFMGFLIVNLIAYIINGNTILVAISQLREISFAIILFVALKSVKLDKDSVNYYIALILKLIGFQIVFSAYKLVVMGFRENVIGSFLREGGDSSVYLALLGLTILWVYRNAKFNKKDWILIVLFLVIPIASNKRVIWLIYPIILSYIYYYNTEHVNVRKTVLLLCLIPLFIYVGFRINPSFNPERIMWGSFDYQYGRDYIFGYSGVSEKKLSSGYGEGRIGTAITILRYNILNLDSSRSLFGHSPSRYGRVGINDSIASKYGLRGEGALFAALGSSLLIRGLIGTFLYILMNIKIIQSINDRKRHRLFLILFLWGFVFYSGIFSTNILMMIIYSLVNKQYNLYEESSRLSLKKKLITESIG